MPPMFMSRWRRSHPWRVCRVSYPQTNNGGRTRVLFLERGVRSGGKAEKGINPMKYRVRFDLLSGKRSRETWWGEASDAL